MTIHEPKSSQPFFACSGGTPLGSLQTKNHKDHFAKRAQELLISEMFMKKIMAAPQWKVQNGGLLGPENLATLATCCTFPLNVLLRSNFLDTQSIPNLVDLLHIPQLLYPSSPTITTKHHEHQTCYVSCREGFFRMDFFGSSWQGWLVRKEIVFFPRKTERMLHTSNNYENNVDLTSAQVSSKLKLLLTS